MTDDLLAYLLDDLSPERRAEVDAKLATDVVWRWELERLRECLAASGALDQCATPPAAAEPDALEASHPDLEPPIDLVQKTCCFVEDSASGKFKIEKKRCQQQRVMSAADCEGGNRGWSLADVTVGAGILLILAALILPAVQHSRDAARSNVCGTKMKAIHVALENHAINRGGLPELSSSDPTAMLIAQLVAAGFMSQADAAEVVTCPNSPQAQRLNDLKFKIRVPAPQELRAATGQELLQLIAGINLSYAFRLGYRDANGDYRQVQMRDLDSPMMADAPAATATGLQPVNHGCRQNILMKSGSVRTLDATVLPANDADFQSLFWNNEGEQAAGSNEDDVVLATPYGSGDGPLNLSLPKVRPAHLQVLCIEFRPHAATAK